MKGPAARDCRMDVTFHSTQDGRPEIFDFLWEHAPQLYTELNQKKVCTRLHIPLASPGKKTARKKDQYQLVESFVQKFVRDKRFKPESARINTKKGLEMEATLNSKHLESALSAYNVLFEAALSNIQLESSELQMDFSFSNENMVRIHTMKNHAQRVKDFLQANCQSRPGIRTITFGKQHPLQPLLKKGGK